MGTHRFVIDGKEYEVDVGTRLGSNVQVTVNGKTYDVEVSGQESLPATPAPSAARPAAVQAAAPSPPPPVPGTAGSGEVRAPIPGVVLTVDVSEGDQITAATKCVVLEAMKMENEIFAGVDGVVAKVHVKPQQEVRQGDLLVTISPS